MEICKCLFNQLLIIIWLVNEKSGGSEYLSFYPHHSIIHSARMDCSPSMLAAATLRFSALGSLMRARPLGRGGGNGEDWSNCAFPLDRMIES